MTLHDFIEVDGEDVHIYPHEGQIAALNSTSRIVMVVSGSQGGKSSTGPIWLQQEMMEKGVGDYLVIAPTYSLLEFSALPKFRQWFEETLQLGRYVGSPSRRFIISDDGARRLWGHALKEQTTVRFAYASKSNSVEALTLKACWADECGQSDFKGETFQNIYTRRLAVHQGRILLTSTPYSVDGWFRDLCDKGERGDIDCEVIRFDSTKNPAFTQDSFEEARRTLPSWRFDMMFKGIFSRPAGQIYHVFKDTLAPKGHLVKRFPIPDSWERFMGMDFGSVNTAAVKIAKGQGIYEGKLVVYNSYHAGNRTCSGHTIELTKGEPRNPICYGGAPSEDNYRCEYTQAGMKVNKPPITEVEIGIDRVWAAFNENQIIIFDDLKSLITELRAYSRKVDDSGNVTEEIDKKSTFHRLDALRYIMCHLRHKDISNKIIRPMAAKIQKYGGGFA